MWNKLSGSKTFKHQSGFTLVELAIVLVIVGLILGAVLKGQQMIENGKVKSVENDLKGVVTAYYAYQDRYKAIPGDDKLASTHVSGVTINGNGNGLIEGLYGANAAPVDNTTESNNFWDQIRKSGFMTGSGYAPATNSLGGMLGVQGSVNTYGMTGNVVCAGSIPVKIAQAVDIAIDDGNGETGTVRAGAAGVANLATTTTATAAAESYGATPATTDTLHTLCMKI